MWRRQGPDGRARLPESRLRGPENQREYAPVDYADYGFMAHTFRVKNPKGDYVEIAIGPTLEEQDFYLWRTHGVAAIIAALTLLIWVPWKMDLAATQEQWMLEEEIAA